MGKGCINGVLDDTKYSSLLPLIGLYIAIGSAVCMLFMLFDIISSFRHRKQRWIPCRLFSLNSLTLTLLSICTKIPVDLTTSMPGIYDQLAKITGTTLVCISMGFLSPSIGDSNDRESLTNVAALTIFVITVAVNISMQISTGVIYLFVGEHIILIVCMFVLLLVQWVSAMNINKGKDIFLDFNKNLVIKGEGSILQRLKLSYLHGVSSNPQFRICAAKPHLLVVAFSVISFGVLAQATLRCLIMKRIEFFHGTSDYKWSMKMIVMFQILTVIVGGLAISARWISAASNILNDELIHEEVANTIIRKNPILRASLWDRFRGYIQKIPLCLIVVLGMVAWIPMTFLTFLCCCGCILWVNREQEESTLGEYKDVVGEHELTIYKWIARKAVNDMNIWMDVSRKKRAITLSVLFSRIKPSPLLLTLKLDDVYPDQAGIEVSSLSMALLVKIAAISLPYNLSVSLERSFSEAYKIIDFIETRIKSATRKTRMKKKFVKSVLLGGGFDVLVPKIMVKSGYVKEFQFQNELTRALVILKDLKTFLPSDVVADEVGAITDLINRREYQTIQDLYNYIEQIFVDMLHLFLVQFPNAIYKHVMESSAEEFEERIAVVLKLLWKIELLEDKVKWLFPDGSSISGLINPGVRDSALNDSNRMYVDVSIQP